MSAAELRTTTRRAPYGIVPEALVQDTRLSAHACRLAVWLAIRPPGWVVHPEHAQVVLGMGRDAYYSARRQLIDSGYITCSQERGANGRMAASVFVFDAEPLSGLTVSGQAGYGATGCGQPSHITLTGNNSNNHTTTTGAGEPVVVCGDFFWPDCISITLRPACLKTMIGLNHGQQQHLLDELSGQPVGKVKNPARWLARLVPLVQRDCFVPEVAPAVREARETRERVAAKTAEASVAAAREQTPAEKARSAAIKATVLTKLRAIKKQSVY